MGMTKITRRLAAWIASFAILLVTLAPTISHAVAAVKTSGGAWMEICSIAGFKATKVEADHQHAGPGSAPVEHELHFEHCPFCSTHGGSLGLPPSAGFTLPATDGAQFLPFLYYRSPTPLFIWARAQSRAPPFASLI